MFVNIYIYIYIEIHNYIYMENPPIKVDGFPGGKPWLFFTNSCFAKLLEGYRTSKVRRGPEMASGVRPFTHSNSGYLVDQPPASKPPQE